MGEAERQRKRVWKAGWWRLGLGAQIRRPDVGNRRPADWTENQKSLKAQLSGKEGKGEI